MKPKEDEKYRIRDRCWYGQIFHRYPDAVTARQYSRWHNDFDRIVKVWHGWKIMPGGNE